MMAGLEWMSTAESLLVSAVGMGVVMAELFLLSLFVRLLARVGSVFGKRQPPKTAASPVSAQQPNTAEMAAALAASFATYGVVPSATQTVTIQAAKVD